MLREIFTWLATPCPPAARKLGYLQAAVGLESRARRCRQAWAGHLEQCHRAILQSLGHCTGQRTALILGSGLALEYPLEELSARFRRVVLVDIVHLPAVRRRARRHANVELLTCDLSGLTAALLATRPPDIHAPLPAPSLANIADVDWVVSCNLLSQLPLLPAAWLGRRHPQLNDIDIERWGRRIMAHHLDWLGSFAGERCLIADAEQTTRDRDGAVIEHADIASAFGLNEHAYASWRWNIAPQGELAAGMSADHRVVACRWPPSPR
ncbi:MAG: hypothetical protein Q7U97_16140 [Rhodocyclaceae bacterium]|jgi:hypothetical protein|nr:hypothetical protein [Rhodocyclaceae bacterium]